MMQPDNNQDPERKGSPPLVRYAFPTRSRCRSCGSLRTLAASTQGRYQHRKCQRCGANYKEIGWEV